MESNSKDREFNNATKKLKAQNSVMKVQNVAVILVVLCTESETWFSIK